MRRFWLFAAVLFLVPFVGCTHETTPDQAMQVMSTGLANNKPQVAWEGLPPSYQKDVEGLIKDFAGKMDPEIWDGGFGVAKKVVRILQEKKSFLLESPMLQLTKTDPKVLEEHWDDVVKAVSILVNSDVSKIDELKKINMNEFLSTTGADFMEHLTALAEVSQQPNLKNDMADYKTAKFTLVKSQGDTATINVEVPNQEIEPVEMVKVEGKWIPKELADNWADQIKKAKESLAAIDTEQMKQNKEPLMAQIKMVDAQLNLLLDAKTSEDFNGKLSGIAMAMMMGGGGGGPPSTSFGGDFGPGPNALGGEDMPAEEGAEDDTDEAPTKKSFEDKTTNGDDPLFEGQSGTKPESDESAGEAPAEAPESETPAEDSEGKEPATESESDPEAPADESEKDAPAEDSEAEAPAEESDSEAPAEETKPE